MIAQDWDALLASLHQRNRSADGATMQEIAGALGVSLTTATRRVNRAVAAGHLEFAGYRMETDIVGRAYPRPVYRPARHTV